MDIDYQALLESFLQEGRDYLNQMEESLLELERNPLSTAPLQEIFRFLHTIKGDAGTVGASGLADFAHRLEEHLGELGSAVSRQGDSPVNGSQEAAPETGVHAELITLLLQSVDAMHRMLKEATEGHHEQAEATPEEKALLDAIRQTTLSAFEAQAKPQKKTRSKAKTPSKKASSRSSNQTAKASAEKAKRRPRASKTSTAKPSSEAQDVPQRLPEPAKQGNTHRLASKTLRVPVEKLDQLMNLTGELAVARARMGQLIERPPFEALRIAEVHEEADRLHLELRELVTSLRLVPVGPTFRLFHRQVRDLAQRLGRQAQLVIEGEDVEVDNAILRLLRDPLSHLIRNCLTHGIETPAQRRKAGKPEQGTLTLSAWHEGGVLRINLQDDGIGINRDRTLQRAVELGLVQPQAVVSNQQLFQFIFEPGFSTAEEVTDLSGRGVGMDIVRRSLDALRGQIGVSSTPCSGTTISLQVPLTLAIIDGLVLRVSGDSFVLPLENVIETLELPVAKRNDDLCDVLSVRERALPYIRLRRLLKLNRCCGRRENLVVARNGQEEVGLIVDEVTGKQQSVIKPLSPLLPKISGISGSTVLGDGSVAFILDLPSLMRQSGLLNTSHLGAGITPAPYPRKVLPPSSQAGSWIEP